MCVTKAHSSRNAQKI